MNEAPRSKNMRIIIIDDNEAIHQDFRKIFATSAEGDDLAADEAILFGEEVATDSAPRFDLDSAMQGREGLERVCKASQSGHPYALAFVDIRMPPGWDGIETISRIAQEDLQLQFVICTAYSDYSWLEINRKLKLADRLLVLKKPFEPIEVRQLAQALVEKWNLARDASLKLDELERMVADRIRDIQRARDELAQVNEELTAARDAAESASRSKSSFLANMSHEIRTPMTAILGFTEKLSDPALSVEERRDAVETIRRNGRHLLELLDDILDISKIEAQRLRIERIPCSPCELLANLESLMRVRAEEKGLAFELEFPGPIPESIETDPTRLKQVLVNLVSNAIKFTGEGSVRIVTEFVGGEEAAGGSGRPAMRFRIIDSGIGISDEQVGRLFEPFMQADDSTTRKFGGTGLGLAISRRLVHMLGGELSVRSAPGQGSVFTATIDAGDLREIRMLANPASAIRLAQRDVDADDEAALRERLDCRVLLAEDTPDNQRLVSFILRRNGASVTVAPDGSAAVTEALEARRADRPFDVILMDMQMPVMDGYEAVRVLREKGYGGTIIALTAHSMVGDRERCVAAGCDDYVAKPIDRSELIRKIQHWTSAARTKASPASVQT